MPSVTYEVIASNNKLPHQRLTSDLDGVTYGLELDWNAAELFWYLTLWDSSFTTRLLAGRKLTISAQVLGRFRLAVLPPGELTLVDTTGKYLDPGLLELGQRVLLVYIPAAAVAAITAASAAGG